MPRKTPVGVFCLESRWTSDLRDRQSAKPLLEVLEHAKRIKFMHGTVNTPNDLCCDLKRWTQKQYASYSVGYLALHGQGGCVNVGKKSISLADLSLELAGSCAGKTIYFGSCSTFDMKEQDIAAFRKVTKAKCVAGYTKDVDWLEAAAFELLLFDCLSYYKRSDAVHHWLCTAQKQLVKRLGFEMYYGK